MYNRHLNSILENTCFTSITRKEVLLHTNISNECLVGQNCRERSTESQCVRRMREGCEIRYADLIGNHDDKIMVGLVGRSLFMT